MTASTLACSKGSSAAPADNSASAATASAATSPQLAEAAAAPDPGPLPQIDSRRAFQYIKEIVAFGPRPIGSENHKKLENYITAHLKGDQVEDDAFTADTVEGKFPVRNIIAKYPGTKDGIIVILGHYDTNYPLRKTGYVGANDGGSSTAILLEYANHLRGKKRDGYSVWLVWTDGEEAVRQWTETDSLYGTRHLAEKWEKDGTLKKIKALFVMDMIGDADLNIDRDTNSTSWLLDLVYEAAERSGVQSHFYARAGAMEDDHLPFVKRGVPSMDVIDLDYGYNNVFHHTPQDTLDKLSPRSLEIVGNTTLEAIRTLDRR
ncbi:MAG: M28 family peptidase [Candidatus Koribacter versatilis]|nr:M28 family peptidase [Candidatus Koribacter versatilis]